MWACMAFIASVISASPGRKTRMADAPAMEEPQQGNKERRRKRQICGVGQREYEFKSRCAGMRVRKGEGREGIK